MRVRRALFSLTDKSGVAEFAGRLAQHDVEILSTGNTAKVIREAKIPVTDVSEYTGFPEMLDGRVKTLHPRIHGGLLGRRDLESHQAEMAEHDIPPIDLVAVNLYPFEAVTSQRDVDLDTAIENIDIGGPSMIRSAAKNHASVAVIVDPADYSVVADELETSEMSLSPATLRRLARKAFARTAAYDAAIDRFLSAREEFTDGENRSELNTEFLRMGASTPLRYGENPHQDAVFMPIVGAREPSVATAKVLSGKELSYNNLVDCDAAYELVREFDQPACVVIKHTNPCGAAIGTDQVDIYERAVAGDPVSAFGGILAFNREVTLATAEEIARPDRFFECIIAPSFAADAKEIITGRPKWGKSVRLLSTGEGEKDHWDVEVKKVRGGLLLQTRDHLGLFDPMELKVGTPLTSEEESTLRFAWVVAKHVKSNAIVLARDGALVGTGAGQMSRVDSVRIAIDKAGDRAKGALLASDAFFPFRDGIDTAAAAGVKVVVQPGGSRRDDEILAAASEHGMTMLFTGVRHFRH